jgi:hypothetical protein
MKFLYRCVGGYVVFFNVDEHTLRNEGTGSRPHPNVTSIITSSSAKFFIVAQNQCADIVKVFTFAEGEELCLRSQDMRPGEILGESIASVLLEILEAFLRL